METDSVLDVDDIDIEPELEIDAEIEPDRICISPVAG